MRTTVTLDDDLVTKLRNLAHRRRTSFKELVNSLLRRGLAAQDTEPKKAPFRIDPFRSKFRAGVDPQRLNQVADDLEAERAAGRLR